jgi:hypothetical protein
MPTRPEFWTTRIECPFIRSLAPSIVAAFVSGEIGRERAAQLVLEALYSRVARQLRHDRSLDPIDAAHETFTRFAETGLADRFDAVRSRSGWPLFDAVLRRVASDMRRRVKERTAEDTSLFELKAGFDADPSRRITQAEDLERVRSAYFQLTPRQQDALLVLYPFLDEGRRPTALKNVFVNRHRAAKAIRRSM